MRLGRDLVTGLGSTSQSIAAALTSPLASSPAQSQDLLVDAVTMLAVNAPPAFERAATLAIAGLLASAGSAMVWGAYLAISRRSAPTAVSLISVRVGEEVGVR